MDSSDKKILFVHDFPLYLDEDMNLYTAVGLPESYFDRFFDSDISVVYILTRFKKSNKKEILLNGYIQIVNKNIKPFFIINKYIKLFNVFSIFNFIKRSKEIDYFVLSTPSIIGLWVNFILITIGKKYSLEFAGEASMFRSKLFGGFVSWIFSISLPYLSRKSVGNTYVTNSLHQVYPNSNYLIASNVNLPDSIIAHHEKKFIHNKSPIIFSFIGGITKRKGIDLIINLAERLTNDGMSVKFFLYGGHSDFDWESLISKKGLSDIVSLMGIHKTEIIFKMLQKTDIYIQPSNSEGIPRATIEAMSQGVPIAATTLDGFKELLDSSVLFPPGDLNKFHVVVKKLIVDHSFYFEQSKINLSNSKNFVYSKLHLKRVKFYRGIFNES